MSRMANEVFESGSCRRFRWMFRQALFPLNRERSWKLARALITDPDFLVLDEISQALSQDNRKVLYRFIDEFKAQGKTILMVTHDLEEMVEICDEIAVLRDGVIVKCKDAKAFTMDELKREMIGREVSGDYYRDDQKEDYQKEVVLEVDHLNVPGKCEDISFEVHKGEILGVCVCLTPGSMSWEAPSSVWKSMREKFESKQRIRC